MTENKHFPFLCRKDAVNEYNSLRNEIIESQKQRTSLLNYSLVLIAVLFGYLVADDVFSSSDALILIVLTIAPSLFSYATRCRERRIANYLSVYLKKITPWSSLSSKKASLGFFQRSSTTIIVLIILLDIIFLCLSWPFQSSCHISNDQLLSFVALFFLALNVVLAICTNKLPDFTKKFQEEYNKLKNEHTPVEKTNPPDA